jgi:predicted nicotinamide N-methyase
MPDTAGTGQVLTEPSEFTLSIAGREVSVLHRQALVTWLEEQIYLSSDEPRQYGTVLWPSSIALALEIGERAAEFHGRRVLELGAGVGLAGIAAASVGAKVMQTDRDEDALAFCRDNAMRNGVAPEQRAADWSAWSEGDRYDWIIAADILYRETLHAQLRAIFAGNLTPAGRVLVADPLRSASVRLLQAMEREGWSVRMTRYTIGEGEDARAIGVFEVKRRAGSDGTTP